MCRKIKIASLDRFKVDGFGTVEYIVSLVALALVFLTPFKDGKSVTVLLVEGVKNEHANYIYAQSVSQFQITSLKSKSKVNNQQVSTRVDTKKDSNSE